MAEEKEIHFIVRKNDISKIVSFITKAGFKFGKVIHIEDTYFEDNDFSLLKSKKGYRKRVVNREESGAKYCYKEIQNDKVYENEYRKEEFEKKVKDLSRTLRINKDRVVYLSGKNEIVIDDLGEHGYILEIECQKNDPRDIFESLKIPPEWLEETRLGCQEIVFNKLFPAKGANSL